MTYHSSSTLWQCYSNVVSDLTKLNVVMTVSQHWALAGKLSHSKEYRILHIKYSRYLHKLNTIVFIILSANKWANFTCLALFRELIWLSYLCFTWWTLLAACQYIALPNKSTLPWMVLERWNLLYVMEEMIVNTVVTVVRRYPKYLHTRIHFLWKISIWQPYILALHCDDPD